MHKISISKISKRFPTEMFDSNVILFHWNPRLPLESPLASLEVLMTDNTLEGLHILDGR